jgi:glycosyltransferase involved in cell wall biosynthesis
MRLGIVVTASVSFGGAETNMLRLAQHLEYQGHHLEVFIPKSNKAVASLFEASGMLVHDLEITSILRFLRFCRELDLIYVMGPRRGVLWTFLASVVAGVPAIGSERSSGFDFATKICHALSSIWCDTIIANNTVGARVVSRCAGAFCDTACIPNGLIPPYLTPSLRDIDVVCIANITPNKGQLVLADAVSRIQENHPGLKADLFGSDYTGGDFFKEAYSRGLDKFFTYHGVLTDIWPVLSRAKICVLPSVTCEGLPTVLVESSFAGSALIASDIGGVRDVCIDNFTGLLTVPGEAESVATAIDRLLKDDKLRGTLSSNAKTRAESHFTLKEMSEGHLKVFSTALSR